ncbi:urea amidolyase family protein [Microbacterium aerolatum]|uniref:5-oxoprolinase subunit B/C family protein n=1 Tax=Microbacterium aerolatum TaxID=153731 RepID=UPI002000CC44|nr:urea amidolyase family protein [Microbacterium aerolatum]MCK3768813.1 urea amidolyase family protein [Microbacterium aerolatum]
MRILTASDRSLLVEAADLDEAMRLNLAWDGVPGIVERIPGARTVLVRFDPVRTSAAALASVLEATELDAEHVPHTREVTVPVRYDGEDLTEAAGLLGVSAEELVNRHLAADWQVAFSGFAPGFGYIVSSDPLFDVPRRSSPRTRVPAGSVALAGQFTGVYPRESPGGWQLIGRTDAVMWDIDRDPPALLAPGTSVRFQRASREVATVRSAMDASGRDMPPRASGALPPDPMPARPEASIAPLGADGREGSPREETPRGALSERSETKRGERAEGESKPSSSDPQPPSVEVIRPSMQLLVQDAGRPGHAALGVSASGAADRTAMRDANRAVGNQPGAAVLESVGGATLRFHGDGVAVVTGAEGDLTLTDANRIARNIPHATPFATVAGDELALGHPTRGLRYVIGIRGGLAAASALGSRAADTLAGLGPDALAAGDVIAIGNAVAGAVDPLVQPRELPASGDLVELDITLGPRDDWFTASALQTLTTQEWLVTPRSDRVGIRLHGGVPLERATQGELPSEGAVTGAIQVPADGQPVLFLPDHPLTGGYPIIGALTDRCLDLAAQLPPGARIRFRIEEGQS